MTTGQCQYGQWSTWTPKSDGVDYKSTTRGIGHGEMKFGAEVGLAPLGQNSPYDFNLWGVEADVKQLDHNTFNTGVCGKDRLRPTKNRITSLCRGLHDLPPDTLDLPANKIQVLRDMNCDEVCEGNIRLLHRLIQALADLRHNLATSLPALVPAYDPVTGDSMQCRPDQLLGMMAAIGKTEEEIEATLGEEVYHHANLLRGPLQHPYVQDPDRLGRELSELTDIFSGTVLIFVDEDRGYYAMRDPEQKIAFQRITLGGARFKLRNSL